MKIAVVGNSFVLKYFKNIDIFRLELGSSLKGPVNAGEEKNYKDGKYRTTAPSENKIVDDFIVKYYENFDRLIHVYGFIGEDPRSSVIKFYNDIQLLNNELYIFKDDFIYELAFSDDIRTKPRDFLSEVLENIEKQEILASSKLKKFEGIDGITNMPEGIERPDMSLPTEQYIIAMVERRKRLNNMDDNSHVKELINRKADKSNLDLDEYVHEIARKQREKKHI